MCTGYVFCCDQGNISRETLWIQETIVCKYSSTYNSFLVVSCCLHCRWCLFILFGLTLMFDEFTLVLYLLPVVEFVSANYPLAIDVCSSNQSFVLLFLFGFSKYNLMWCEFTIPCSLL